MNHTHFWTAAAIIACVVVIGFAFSVPHTHDIVKTTTTPSSVTAVPAVTLHDSFKKGLHTITGSLEAPNACTIVTARAVISGNASSTESIVVPISMPNDVGVCLQLSTLVNFSVTISAPAHLPMRATVNGHEATTTVS